MNEYTYNDVSYDVMEYCLNACGKWWANHFFRNKEVNEMYADQISKPLNEVFRIVS